MHQLCATNARGKIHTHLHCRTFRPPGLSQLQLQGGTRQAYNNAQKNHERVRYNTKSVMPHGNPSLINKGPNAIRDKKINNE